MRPPAGVREPPARAGWPRIVVLFFGSRHVDGSVDKSLDLVDPVDDMSQGSSNRVGTT